MIDLDEYSVGGYEELPSPRLYPRLHRELLRAIVAAKTGISYYRVHLKELDAAYSVAFPNSTPINVNKKKYDKINRSLFLRGNVQDKQEFKERA